jgi:membrane-associated phospholipid phosphatase
MKRCTFFVFSLFCLVSNLSGQTPSPTPTPQVSLEKHFVSNILRDQKAIWLSPFKLDRYDAKWISVFGLGTASLIASDRSTSEWVGKRGGLPVISHDVSWAGKAYTTAGVAAAFYLTGRATHNAKASETGILVFQSLIDTGIVTEALKLATQRERPNSGFERAEFFEGGSSFPSGHSSSVWSVATVIAYEYKDHPLVKYGAFAAATAVSMSRFSSREHFLSDVVVGSAIGFGIGRYVYRTYHDPNTDAPKQRSVTRLFPTLIPYYDARTRTYGGSVSWRLPL